MLVFGERNLFLSITNNDTACKLPFYNDMNTYFLVTDIKEHVKCIEKAVATKEPRFTLRTLRAIPGTRRKLSHPLLRKLICGYMPLGE